MHTLMNFQVRPPEDILERFVSLDEIEGRPDMGTTNLIASCPRVPVTIPLVEVINYMLSQPTQ